MQNKKRQMFTKVLIVSKRQYNVNQSTFAGVYTNYILCIATEYKCKVSL